MTWTTAEVGASAKKFKLLPLTFKIPAPFLISHDLHNITDC